MSDLYGKGSRELQDRFGTRKLADRIEERLVKDVIDEDARTFITSLDMFYLATVDAEGHPSCSYKGGARGFVRVLDERTLAFPSMNGNGMYLSNGAITETGEVAMLFIDFEGQSRLRVTGRASIDPSDPLVATWPEAEQVVRVHVRKVFPNCPRYIHKRTLVQSSRFVPCEGASTPVPSWKKAEWAADVIPENDAAHDTTREILKR